MKLDFNDLLIVPKTTSTVLHRADVSPYTEGVPTIPDVSFLPLITAPMDTVVDKKNEAYFLVNGIRTCLPRGGKTKFGFKSYSVDTIQMIKDFLEPEGRYLIDVANGHMSVVLDLVTEIKKRFPNLSLMVGNIANPETFRLLSDAGADYIRVGIGNGGGCLTSQCTGVGYPMASLIKECYDISCTLSDPAYIIADGGMQTYSDIIKALALGADYVMLGSILNKTLESAGNNYLWKRIGVPQKLAEKCYNLGIPVYKKFRGMSTKAVQRKWGAKKLRTSEGVTRFRKVEYTLEQWVENFEDYLRSAMSYTGSRDLKEFIGQVNLVEITSNAYKRFNK